MISTGARLLPWLAALCFALSSPAWAANAATDASAEPVTVFLVRHAERAEDGTRDPPISVAGYARANLLAEMLADAGITHIHSTDYVRTRQTVAPLADALGLSVQMYDPDDLEGLARTLAATPGRHLVVGHSDTTPVLAEALTGEPVPPIAHMEYDRLYLITLSGDAPATVLLRFGGVAEAVH